ncbi:MAG: 3-isopropylmalate dehydratase large subunit [Kiritimatiellae bacterium]|nr:3-isopropylmalate dehydratase large subunit [Kiritimatiellia bacterium]
MSMTMSQKILARAAGLKSVLPGQLIEAKLSLVLGNDITAPVAIREFARTGCPRVFDKGRIALVPDHFTPNKDIKAAQQCQVIRMFAHGQQIEHYFEIGEMGVEHALLPEQGLVGPGDLIIGADSHTCTYGGLNAFATGVGSTDMAAGMALGTAWFKVPSAIRIELKGSLPRWVSGKDLILHIIGRIGVDGALYRSMEYRGPGVTALTVDDRLCVANMAIEAGAKNGIFPSDEQTRAFLKEAGRREYVETEADPDAPYDETIAIDLASLRPTVAFPHLPSNTRLAAEAGETRIDQVVIGSCTNGRLSDLRVAAQFLAGRKVHKGLRCLIIPATQRIYLAAMREGLLASFIEAGAVVSTPTCGPCLGGHMGILAEGERALATTNRNFVGRMGHPKSEVYLCGPAVAAASALTGRITDPNEILR